MKNEDFKDGFPGVLKKIPEGVYAFIPNKLPPKLDIYDKEILDLEREANNLIGELKGIGRTLQDPYLLISPLSYREALLSSKLEGTIASAEEVAIYSAEPERYDSLDTAREVQNYMLAMNHGLQRLSEIPVSKRLIREVHEKLMNGVRGQEFKPGQFRTGQNHIGTKGHRKIQNARFVPPPATHLEDCLDDVEKYLNSQRPYPPLIDLALIHYQFEAIHPFMDGNGRIGRLIIVLLLCSWEILSRPLLYMSSYFERNSDTYKDLLLDISQEGAWLSWVKFFLQGVIEQSQDTIKRSDKLRELQQNYHKLFHSAGSSALTLKLIDRLFSAPFLTTSIAAKSLDVTPKTAQNHIDKLVKAGVLEEVTKGMRNRIYLAKGILNIIKEE